jgi:hypothetical protein
VVVPWPESLPIEPIGGRRDARGRTPDDLPAMLVSKFET